MLETNKEISPQEKLEQIIQDKKQKNEILKKLLKEINKETDSNNHSPENDENLK